VAPVVNASGTQVINCTANCTSIVYTCPGCAGTLGSVTGTQVTYTAPATIHAAQSYGGYQLFPNDSIFNQRVDSLSVSASSATWIAGAGTVPFSIKEFSFPINYVNGSTPTQSMVFDFTSGNNGSFQIVGYPAMRVESGEFQGYSQGPDQHYFAIDSTNGTFQEIYDQIPAGTLSPTCSTCNALSGIRYLNSTYGLPNSQGGGADAAGLYMMPLELRLQEVQNAINTSGTIKHALRMTLVNGYICGSSTANACGCNAVGTRHCWPATSEAFAGSGVVPYGAWFRLKAAYNCGAFSSIAQIFCTELKQYGVILADGGTSWATQTEDTAWPAAIDSAFAEISNTIATSNFEAIEPSGLMLSSTSMATTNSETVVATASGGVTKQQIVLTGVTVGFLDDVLNIQAGTPAQTLRIAVHGGATNAYACTMSPSNGALVSGSCLYTPPSTIASVTKVTVTGTSSDDGTVAATMTIVLYPTGTIYARPGATAAYTDASSHVWAPAIGNWGHLGCCGNLSAGGWPGTTDIAEYYFQQYAINDNYFNFTLPNGVYQITAKFGTDASGTGQIIEDLEAQGTLAYTDLDIFTAAGGSYLPVDESFNATVSTGQLSFVVRQSVNGGNATINALQITKLSSSVTPSAPVLKGLLVQ
jgi:hypothetical protein